MSFFCCFWFFFVCRSSVSFFSFSLYRGATSSFRVLPGFHRVFTVLDLIFKNSYRVFTLEINFKWGFRPHNPRGFGLRPPIKIISSARPIQSLLIEINSFFYNNIIMKLSRFHQCRPELNRKFWTRLNYCKNYLPIFSSCRRYSLFSRNAVLKMKEKDLVSIFKRAYILFDFMA